MTLSFLPTKICWQI